MTQKNHSFAGDFYYIAPTGILVFVSPTGIEPVPSPSEGDILSVKLRRQFFLQVRSKGIEPLLQDPQSCVLSVERRKPTGVYLIII